MQTYIYAAAVAAASPPRPTAGVASRCAQRSRQLGGAALTTIGRAAFGTSAEDALKSAEVPEA